MKRGVTSAILVLAGVGLAAGAAAQSSEQKAEGYAEYRTEDGCLVVDAQRVCAQPGHKFKGKDAATGFAAIPLGYEVEAKGTRRADGVLVAREIEAKPNGKALFESEVLAMTDAAEANYRKAGHFYQEAGQKIQSVGRLYESGPQWERARRITDSLLPGYVPGERVRVYVIENKEWNAFAMGNHSLYVFSGLLDDMDDDEVAIVLGHELAHATHEHTRKQFKKAMWIQLAALGVAAAAQEVDSKTQRAVLELVAAFGAMAWSNGYGRSLEDQADRVGLRYAYEAGYDVTKGPRLWQRFAQKYGQPGKVANFFFSNHSQSAARAAKLETELAFNYPDGPKPGGVRQASRPRPQSTASAAVAAPAAASALAASAAPAKTQRAEIRAGMGPEEVRQILGDPREELVFGERTRWSYPDLTVVFEKGKVKEVKF
jgi:hypothetical protein